MTELINTILNKLSTYTEFQKLFVNHIPKGDGRVDIIADCYKTKSIKSSEQLLRGQSGKIHIALLLSKVPSYFQNRILRNSDSKIRLIKFIFEYIEKEAKHCLELLGSFEVISSSRNKCILVTATERHEIFHLLSSQEEADTKLIFHAHKILKDGSSKLAIHSPFGDTDILLLALAHLYEYKERIYIVNIHINGHGKYKKT